METCDVCIIQNKKRASDEMTLVVGFVANNSARRLSSATTDDSEAAKPRQPVQACTCIAIANPLA